MNESDPVIDVTIIGGGPAGLFAAFYAGLRSMRVRIIESMDYLGGQLTTLYSDRFIYDVAGHPAILARTLASELVRQALSYHPAISLGEQVERLRHRDDGLLELRTAQADYRSRAVIVAAGGGVFAPQRLPGLGLEAYEGRGIEYFLIDISDYRRRRVLVVGGGDAAIDRALLLRRVTDHVTLVHRHERLRALDTAAARLQEAGVDVRLAHDLRAVHGRGQVESATLFNRRTATEEILPVDAVVISVGFTSTLGPIHDWDLAVEGGGIAVTTRMETSLPGVYAAGDVAAYPGKLKLLAVAAGEAATAVNHAKAWMDPSAGIEPGHSITLVPLQREAARRSASQVGPGP